MYNDLTKRRELKLIKKILYEVVESELGVPVKDEMLYRILRRYDPKIIFFHVKMLQNVGLIDAIFDENSFAIVGLSWNGYEYFERL